MSKKQIFVTLFILVLAGIAAYLLKDWLKPEPIQITCLIRAAQPSARPKRNEAPSGRPGYNVVFAFNHKVILTSVKVSPLADALTNKYPRTLWHLTSSSNSVPTKSVVYGERIRGMQPTIKGAIPDTLESGTSYRLFIEADGEKAQRDFQIPR